MEKIKNKYHILIDQKPFEIDEPSITGLKIKKLVNAPVNYGVWLKVNGPSPDLEISDNQHVDLSQHGSEHFFTGPKQTTEG